MCNTYCMSNEVQFDEEQWSRPSVVGNNEPRGLIGFVIKKGLAKDERQANVILIIFLITIIVITTFLFSFSGSHTTKPSPTVLEIMKTMPIVHQNI